MTDWAMSWALLVLARFSRSECGLYMLHHRCRRHVFARWNCGKNIFDRSVLDRLLNPLRKTFWKCLLDTFHKLLLGLRRGTGRRSVLPGSLNDLHLWNFLQYHLNSSCRKLWIHQTTGITIDLENRCNRNVLDHRCRCCIWCLQV